LLNLSFYQKLLLVQYKKVVVLNVGYVMLTYFDNPNEFATKTAPPLKLHQYKNL